MSDVFPEWKRREIMSRVRNKDTRAELIVRSILHRLGFRFRLHRSDLPGSPDIVLPRYRTAIFVHGCFWHGHDCPRGKLPMRNRSFWEAKILRNRQRDREAIQALAALGWRTIVIWSCRLSSQIKTVELAHELYRTLTTQALPGGRSEEIMSALRARKAPAHPTR